jgi:hypothetical protein
VRWAFRREKPSVSVAYGIISKSIPKIETTIHSQFKILNFKLATNKE